MERTIGFNGNCKNNQTQSTFRNEYIPKLINCIIQNNFCSLISCLNKLFINQTFILHYKQYLLLHTQLRIQQTKKAIKSGQLIKIEQLMQPNQNQNIELFRLQNKFQSLNMSDIQQKQKSIETSISRISKFDKDSDHDVQQPNNQAKPNILGVGRVISRFLNKQTEQWFEKQGCGCIIEQRLIITSLHFISHIFQDGEQLADQVYFTPSSSNDSVLKSQKQICIKVVNKPIFNHQYFSRITSSFQKYNIAFLQLQPNNTITADYVIKTNINLTFQQMKQSVIYIVGYLQKQQIFQQNIAVKQKEQFFKYKFVPTLANKAGLVFIKNKNNQYVLIGLHAGDNAKNQYCLILKEALKHSKHMLGHVIETHNLYNQWKPFCQKWHIWIKEQNNLLNLVKIDPPINQSQTINKIQYPNLNQYTNQNQNNIPNQQTTLIIQKVQTLQKQNQYLQATVSRLLSQKQSLLQQLNRKQMQNLTYQQKIKQDIKVIQHISHHHSQQSPIIINSQQSWQYKWQQHQVSQKRPQRYSAQQKYQMLYKNHNDRKNHIKILHYINDRYVTEYKRKSYYIINAEAVKHNQDTVEWWRLNHNVHLNDIGYSLTLIDHHLKIDQLIFVANFAHIEMLNLGGGHCLIDDHQWKCLAKHSSQFPNLKILRISHNKIHNVSFHELQSFQSLEYIDFNDNPLNDKSYQELIKFKKFNQNVKVHGKHTWIS